MAGKTVLDENNYVLELEQELVGASVVSCRQTTPTRSSRRHLFRFNTFIWNCWETVRSRRKFRTQFNIYAFPLLNPDGADMGMWRHNANGKDLNRDWVEFSQPETQTVRDYLDGKVDDGKNIQFAVDFHTSIQWAIFARIGFDKRTKISRESFPLGFNALSQIRHIKLKRESEARSYPIATIGFLISIGAKQ